MYEILINVLIFNGILLLLALTICVIQGIIILIDVRKGVKEVKEKLVVFTSILDIGTLLLGGISGFGSRLKKKGLRGNSNILAAMAGIKKGLKVLFKDKGGEDNG
ncbi:MAG: hypothetical protein ABIH69_03625 [bacterium]|nr:hypothetical protein [Candidatus Margulisiibacteriota bacterium]